MVSIILSLLFPPRPSLIYLFFGILNKLNFMYLFLGWLIIDCILSPCLYRDIPPHFFSLSEKRRTKNTYFYSPPSLKLWFFFLLFRFWFVPNFSCQISSLEINLLRAQKPKPRTFRLLLLPWGWINFAKGDFACSHFSNNINADIADWEIYIPTRWLENNKNMWEKKMSEKERKNPFWKEKKCENVKLRSLFHYF